MNHSIEACHTIGIDLAKSSFAVHGADASGTPVFKATCTRPKLLSTLGAAPPCRVVMEACGGAHYWGREIQKLGHDVALIAPIYVKPFVKRQKNDANDAAAIVEAASRPTMRTVPVKSAETQALAALFRARELFVRQRVQTANSIRGLLAEYGVVAPKGIWNVTRLRETAYDDQYALPSLVRQALEPMFEMIEQLTVQIDAVAVQIKDYVKKSTQAQRLMTIPGIGPITAFALLAFAGDFSSFRNGREFAAWLGVTPKEHSTGGRHWTGAITRMGQRDIRRLLVNGAVAVIQQVRKQTVKQEPTWVQRLLASRPTKVVAVALANRMARVVWAVMVQDSVYDPTKCRIS